MRRIIDYIVVYGLVILPGVTVSFDISKSQSKKTIKKALQENGEIFIVCQQNLETQHPKLEDLYRVGTIAKITQVDRQQEKDGLRIFVSGLCAAELNGFVQEDGNRKVEVTERVMLEDLTEEETEAFRRMILSKIEPYINDFESQEGRFLIHLKAVTDLDEMMNEIIQFFNFRIEDKQQILEQQDLGSKAILLGQILSDELEIARIRTYLSEKMQTTIKEKQRKNIYREQIRVLKKELGEDEDNDELVEKYNEQLEQLDANEEIKECIAKSIQRFSSLSSYMSESGVLQEYIETMLAIPWNHFEPENKNISKAESILRSDHYGLDKIKERIMEYVAVHIYKEDVTAPILCFVGPPGTGKTSIVQSIARALGRKYERICLGGVRDEAEIRGHRRTYVGAMPGRIATAMKHAGCSNPLILFDEIDKMGTDQRGDISSAMLEVLDSAQNNQFRDHYLAQPMDLSHVLFVATANSLDTIPKPLLDRMEIIEVSSYLEQEKYHIAKEYLVPRQLEKLGLTKKDITFSKKAIMTIIQNYTREAGVRKLERSIGKVCRKSIEQVLKKELQFPIKISNKNLNAFLGKEKYENKGLQKSSRVGLVHGLAWTSVGGDTLDIEVITLPGEGKVSFTGNMGDVMKESAQLAFLCVKKKACEEGMDAAYFKEHDVHLHIPEGAVPKDGPSAGITMATAMYSAVTNKPVDYHLAMTGELSLLGEVLPIGGLREKIVAAKTRGMTKVLVPKENHKDIDELSDEILEGLQIEYVSTWDEVLKQAIVLQ